MKYALLLLMLPALAHGAGAWERIDMPGGAGYWEVDKASATPTKDGTVRMLFRTTYSGARTAGDRTWDHSIAVVEADCARLRWRVTDSVTYLRAERTGPPEIGGEWAALRPNTAIHLSACR